jgi:proteasome lid subunit RPN8/RPN11
MDIYLQPTALETMVSHARETYPEECCGFFYGIQGENRMVSLAVPVDNQKQENRRRRFEISPLDYMKAEQFADENHLTLLGVYHSHPDHSAIPSQHDLLQAVPFFSYIIVSVKQGEVAEVKSWQLNDAGTFEEETVLATADASQQ